MAQRNFDVVDNRAVVCLVYRKPVSPFFSIERIFALLTLYFKKEFTIKESTVPHNRLLPWNILQNIFFVRKTRAALYHVTGDIHYAVFGLPRNKTLLTIHDCVFMYTRSGAKRAVLRYLFLKWPVARCQLVTTISEQSKMDIVRFSGCAESKVVVIPNPVDGHIFYQDKAFNKEEPVLLFIGSTPNKNLDKVIRAIKGIRCKLLIIARLNEATLSRLQEEKIVYEVCSDLSDAELADKYACADIVLFPSLFEGFGLPVIEGQKAGRAVITSNVSPMREVAGEGACLVEPDDIDSIRRGVLKVIEDDAYRRSIIEKGFENVKQFEPEAIAERYMEAYKTILQH